jgi:FAD/FMN-containing dehydrogenase
VTGARPPIRLSGWGGTGAACRVASPRHRDDLAREIEAGDVIPRGTGRAYGDAALNPRCTIRMTGLNRLLAFDPATGALEVEAGVVLDDIIAAFLPRGWFPAVAPGTRFVTLGGMIAADVHGKNHHRAGSMRAATDWVEVLGPYGIARRCGPAEPLFDWTLGGMGLTGPILRAGIRLVPVETGWMRQTVLAAPDLAAVMAALADEGASHSVAWIDAMAGGASLGRGIVQAGRHAASRDLPEGLAPFPAPGRALTLPVPAPAGLVSRPLIRAVNGRYFRRQSAAAGTALVDWERFFFPLDRLRNWNRLYGRRGFVQFQCVVPPEQARAGLTELLRRTAAADLPCCLAVLKRLGPGAGGISFPMQGWTLALDLPLRAGTEDLMDRLERIALDHAGRFYLAKDARLSAERLTRSDPRVETFRAVRAAHGWAGAFRSLQSERLEL